MPDFEDVVLHSSLRVPVFLRVNRLLRAEAIAVVGAALAIVRDRMQTQYDEAMPVPQAYAFRLLLHDAYTHVRAPEMHMLTIHS